jgi:hypothetical protein
LLLWVLSRAGAQSRAAEERQLRRAYRLIGEVLARRGALPAPAPARDTSPDDAAGRPHRLPALLRLRRARARAARR